MAKRITARVTGGKRLRAFIKNAPEEIKEEWRRVIRQQLEPVASAARANAPADTGRLRTSVKTRIGKKAVRGRVVVRLPVLVRKGSGTFVNLARLMEFGTNPGRFGRMASGPHPLRARPFLFPAWRPRRLIAKAAMAAAVNRAISKAIRK